MRLFGLDITRATSRAGTTGAPVPVRGTGAWYPVVREPYTGAWQRNDEIALPSTLSYAAVFACTTLIASDIGKLRLRLVERDDEGIWNEISKPAFSPVLRKPNRYQLIHKFLEQWIVSKLMHGNAYVLKQRDERNVVIALSVLDPTRVTVLVAPDGAVYYELKVDDLTGVPANRDQPDRGVVVPASEIIHDPMVTLFHPLIGVTPIYACGLVALQGLKIQANSTSFFSNGSAPGGTLEAPGEIDQLAADEIKKHWETSYTGENVGKVAILSGGMKYNPLSVNAADAQLIEQLKWTTETICACFHVPAALVDSSHAPPYANSEPLVQQYYSQCLQTLIVSLTNALDDGLGLTKVSDHDYGTELDVDDLIWMDAKTRTDTATRLVTGGVMQPNEARAKFFGLGSVVGGDAVYMQQQQFSLEALAKRDALADPFAPSTPAPDPAPAADEDDDDEDEDDLDLAAFDARMKALEDLYAA
jgi:HK97 family phage portal protein